VSLVRLVPYVLDSQTVFLQFPCQFLSADLHHIIIKRANCLVRLLCKIYVIHPPSIHLLRAATAHEDDECTEREKDKRQTLSQDRKTCYTQNTI